MTRFAHRASRLGSLVLLILALACSGDGAPQGTTGGPPGSGRGGPGGGGPRGAANGGAAAAVPVETTAVERRKIASFIETNGTLEAENEVDLVARVAAPVVELVVEEGMRVRQGQSLARLDDREIRAQLEIQRVDLAEAERSHERARALADESLISPDELDAERSRYDSARAQVESTEIQLGYTDVRAPFDGFVVARYVHLAEQVPVNAPLFRLSDFDPLLCPIQIPERELNRLQVGQPAQLEVEAFPVNRFAARVLRVRPVVDAATGTVRVTLEVDAQGKLRPGMFARVFVEAETRPDALVVPKAALSLESIGDTIYVAADGVAERREVELGFQEGDFVEVVSGVRAGEQVVVVGQDGLSDGTPIQVLDGASPARVATGGKGGPPGPGGVRGGAGFDPSAMTPEQLEGVRERMRARGLSDDQIEERLAAMRPPGRAAGPGAEMGPGGFDLSALSPEQREQMRERMRARGLSEEEIDDRLGPESDGTDSR